MKKSLNEVVDNISKFYFPKSKKSRFLNKIGNKLYLVRIDGKKYVIKEYSQKLTKQRLQFFERLQNYTNSKMGITPLIKETDDGNLQVHINGLNYDLTEFVQNKTLRPNDILSINDFFFNMGLFVGKIHKTFSELEKDKFFNMESLLYISPQSPNHLLQLLEMYARNNVDESWMQIIKEKIKIVNSYKSGMDMFKDLPKKIVHGDLYLKNILFDTSQKVIGLVDFVQAGIFFRCYEVMRAFIQTNKFFQKIDIDKKNLKIFIKGYAQFINMDKEEILKMLDLYIYVQASDVAFLDVNTIVYGEDSLREYAKYRLKSLSSLYKNRQSLAEAVFNT